MRKALTPITVIVVLCTAYSVSWLQGEPRRDPGRGHSAQDICVTEAAMRHKHFQPSHWRAMVLQQQ